MVTVAQNIAAQGRCLMLSELVLFRTGCMIVARHVINCAALASDRGCSSQPRGTKGSYLEN